MSRAPDSPASLDRLLRAGPAEQDEAWSAFVQEFSFLMLHVARTLSRSRDERMDLYSHLLESLRAQNFARLRRYVVNPESKFTTWLVVVARRICLDQHRSRFGRKRADDNVRKAARRTLKQKLQHLVTEESNLEGLPAGPSASPDMPLRSAQLEGALARALATLDPADRLLLVLRFDDGRTAREIASMLHLPSVFHVYRRINAVLGDLRTLLTAHGVESPAP